jgi:hypothetical protein
VTKAQWELIRAIYDNNKHGVRPLTNQCNARVLGVCFRNHWVAIRDSLVNVTELGKQKANEYSNLDDYDNPIIYRTKW